METVRRLLIAAEQGDIVTVQDLLYDGVFVDIQDGKGTTALQIAAANCHEKLAHLLLQHGSSVNLANSYGWTPLMQAARYGHSSIASLLLQYKARPNARSKLGMTPLMASIRSGHLSTIRILLDAGADISLHCAMLSEGMLFDCDLTPLAAAALHGHDPLVRLLLEKGVSVNEATVSTGLTPLMMAACSGHKQTCQVLLEWGADANITNVCNKTALDIATARGKRDVKAYLEDKTITRCFESEKSHADIIEAIKKGDVVGVQGLLQEDASHGNQMLPEDGSTPLMFAAMFGHLEVVKLLVQQGVDIDKRDKQHGWTALMQAVFSGHTDVAKYLVQAGANVNIQANNGCVALDLACLRDTVDTEMINILARKTISISQFMPKESSPSSSLWNTLNPYKSGKNPWNTHKHGSKPSTVRVWCGKMAQRFRHMKKGRKMSHPSPTPFGSQPNEVFEEGEMGSTSLESNEKDPSTPSHVGRLRLCSFESPLPNCSPTMKDSLDPIVPPLLPTPSKNREKHELDFMPGIRIPSPSPGRAAPKALQPVRLRQQLTPKLVRHLQVANPSLPNAHSMKSTLQEKCTPSSSDEHINLSRCASKPAAEEGEVDKNNSANSENLSLDDLKPEDNVAAILKNLSLQKYQQLFESEEVDVEAFRHLTKTDLEDLGIQTIESREKLTEAIRVVQHKFKTPQNSSR